MIPKRHRRTIVVEGETYYWHFPQGRDWDHRSDYGLVVQAAHGEGRLLKVEQSAWPDVTPAFVAAAIRDAIAGGWRPNESGAPFVLSRSAEES